MSRLWSLRQAWSPTEPEALRLSFVNFMTWRATGVVVSINQSINRVRSTTKSLWLSTKSWRCSQVEIGGKLNCTVQTVSGCSSGTRLQA